MEKTRVKKGKKYCYINDRLFILECIETDSPIDKARFEAGNYFHSSHKLSDIAFKLEKVLKGADVIEMPSEEEYEKIIPQRIGCSDEFAAGEGNGYWHGYNYLKSKIVK